MIFLGRKALSTAVASALLLISSAHATGLGRLTVLSSLGQPLRAEIELTSPSKEEVSSLVPKLAHPDAFRQANIDFNPALLSLRFSIEQRGPGYVIRVSSTQAMNEPFVDMLLEMNSSNGKLLREYTFLLDPAELRNSQSAQVANPVAVATPPQAPMATPPAATATTPPATPPAARAPAGRTTARTPEAVREAKAASDYQVKPGDTLSKIAGTYRPEGVSLDQMLVSLYRANPQAFSGNNMNRLKAGQILSVPDAESAHNASGSAAESHSVVTAHAADFNAYRNKLAGQVARAPAEKTSTGKQSASGTITAKVKEVPTATSESPDKLKLSKVAPGAATKVASGKAAIEEDKLAKDKAVAEANARVKELEKNVGDLQKLLEVKNKDLAAKQVEAAKKDVKAPSDAKVASAAASSVAQASVPDSAAKVPASITASAPASIASASAVLAATSAAASAKPVIKRKPVAPPPPPEEPGFFEGLLGSSFLLPGAAAILALLGGYGIFSSRRKKKLQQFEDSILTGSSMKANSMFGSTGGQSVDTNNSVFNSNFAPSASQLDANEVDPVAEADVYIAYGRDSQAEEILKEALRTQPDRHAVRVKLLEIYFARKDAKMFERLASELYGMTGGEGEEWAQAASMGIALEPGNPLYAGGKAKGDLTGTSALGSGTQPLEDLDPDALLGNSLSQDMLESISIIDTAAGHGDEHATPLESLDNSLEMPELKADSGALDFDLDIPAATEPEVPKIPESQPKASMAEPEDQSPVVDFATIDFDLGGDEQPVPVSAPAHTLPEASKPELNLEPADFNEPVSSAQEISLESLEGMVADMPQEKLSLEPVSAVTALPEIASNLQIKAEPQTASPAQSKAEQTEATAFEFDLSGIDLDLQPESAALESHQPVGGDSAYNAEMATKLDLAVAYHEIGDKEGARELLDEVLKGGTADQIEKAKAMLAQLA